MSKAIGMALVSLVLVGCGVENPPTGELSSAIRRNCSLVLCALPVCAAGEMLETKPNQCCPTCVPARPRIQDGDCVCTGGHMDATYCGEFGAPWSWNNWGCFWSANQQGGLTSEECSAVEAKHAGDGSGSDIYNLGLSCVYGATDCRSKGCPNAQHCDVCRTVDGPAYVCLPDGAVC